MVTLNSPANAPGLGLRTGLTVTMPITVKITTLVGLTIVLTCVMNILSALAFTSRKASALIGGQDTSQQHRTLAKRAMSRREVATVHPSRILAMKFLDMM